jgi:hypothetical protein
MDLIYVRCERTVILGWNVSKELVFCLEVFRLLDQLAMKIIDVLGDMDAVD